MALTRGTYSGAVLQKRSARQGWRFGFTSLIQQCPFKDMLTVAIRELSISRRIFMFLSSLQDSSRKQSHLCDQETPLSDMLSWRAITLFMLPLLLHSAASVSMYDYPSPIEVSKPNLLKYRGGDITKPCSIVVLRGPTDSNASYVATITSKSNI